MGFFGEMGTVGEFWPEAWKIADVEPEVEQGDLIDHGCQEGEIG